MQVIERIAGHYEVQDVEFGTVYKWHPESVVIECECGKMVTLTSSITYCECGADHTAVVQEEEEELAGHYSEEDAHPWRYTGHRDDAGLPF